MEASAEDRRQTIERIMRKAETLGEDPQRVARALGYAVRDPMELQAVEELEPRSWLRRLLARRSPGGSRSS